MNVQRSLHPKYHDEVPLSKAPWAPQHKWLPTAPGVCSRCACSLLCVCTEMGKCRVRNHSMGHHTWLYVTFSNRSSVEAAVSERLCAKALYLALRKLMHLGIITITYNRTATDFMDDSFVNLEEEVILTLL